MLISGIDWRYGVLSCELFWCPSSLLYTEDSARGDGLSESKSCWLFLYHDIVAVIISESGWRTDY